MLVESTNVFLQHSRYIDWRTPSVRAQAQKLAAGCGDRVAVAKSCFEFVRDHIKHSGDFECDGTVCKASDVLLHTHGFCYAKSHLLAALLRANGIVAALCYQRLVYDRTQNQPSYCLHGLNAVYLPEAMEGLGFGEHTGWYRVDARGNKSGVNAEFSPPVECLAFVVQSPNLKPLNSKLSSSMPSEFEVDGLFAEPLQKVVRVLEAHHSYLDVMAHLPDFSG